jgi:hypothetical protein
MILVYLTRRESAAGIVVKEVGRPYMQAMAMT